jgi:hypothetical protein
MGNGLGKQQQAVEDAVVEGGQSEEMSKLVGVKPEEEVGIIFVLDFFFEQFFDEELFEVGLKFGGGAERNVPDGVADVSGIDDAGEQFGLVLDGGVADETENHLTELRGVREEGLLLLAILGQASLELVVPESDVATGDFAAHQRLNQRELEEKRISELSDFGQLELTPEEPEALGVLGEGIVVGEEQAIQDI